MRQIGLRLADADIDSIRTFAPQAETLADAAREVMAAGLLARMTAETNRPVPRLWAACRDAKGIFRLYAEYRDAAAGEAGVVGPLGGRYRLVEVPANSRYAEPDRQTFMPLHEGMAFGEDGELWQRTTGDE